MPYLLQAEEREIPYELFQQLAEIMDESPEIVLADATFQLHHAHGILHIPEKAEAERLCARFNELGFRVFVLEQLLEVPKCEPLNAHEPKVEGPVELVTVGHVETVSEEKKMQWNPLNISMHTGSFGLYATETGLQEWTVERHDERSYLDLLSRTRHWRAISAGPAAFLNLLTSSDFTGVSLSASVRKLQSGDHNIARFAGEKEYDKHVSWLYQVRYARAVSGPSP